MSGQVFRYAVATRRATQDISTSLKGALAPAIKAHQPAVAPKALPELMRDIEGYEAIGDRQTMLGLKVLAHTFVRTGELIGAVWSEFDLDAGLWSIPSNRMKMNREHVVPLSKQVVVLLRELKTMAGNSLYVLSDRNGTKPISNNTLLFSLYRLGYKGRMTGHGFRSIASTILNESDEFSADWIEYQLAHVPGNQVRSAYNRAKYLKNRTVMMQWWSDYLDVLISNNVISINTA